MYAVKSVLCWLVILCCWQETQAKAAFSMLNRTRVALAGEYLEFNLSVVIPANCSGKNEEVHWVFHVDEGYQEPAEEIDNAIITMMAFSGILLIFSVAGSLYILKSYKDQPPCREDKNVVAEQRPEETNIVILDENAASESLYTALQHRSSSIYDTLHPEMMHEENTRNKNSDKKQCKAQEDDVSESVYENL